MRSTQGEIEVFLCPDEPVIKPLSSPSPAQTTASTTTTTLSPQPTTSNSSYYSTETLPSEPVPKTESEIKQENLGAAVLSSAGMRDALLGESHDFNLVSGNKFQLQSEEQNHLGKKFFFIT